MEKLKIAFYSDTYLPAMDGVVVSMLNLKKELEKRGHSVYIFTSGDSKSKKKYSNKNVFIMQGLKFRPYPQYRFAIFPYSSLLKKEFSKIDIIHIHTPFSMGLAGMLASKMWNIPVISTYHTMLTDKNIIDAYYPKNKNLQRITSKYLQKYTTFFYNRSKLTIAPTAAIKNMLLKWGINNTVVIPNSIDLNIFNSTINGAGVKKSLKLKNSDKIILYVGRISKEKRIDTLLKAIKELNKKRNDIKLIICGIGPAMDFYEHMVAKMKLQNVKFLGFIKNKELPKYYAASDLLCLPSTFETQGMVAIEAMAMGKPVVGADYLALKELIKNGKNGEKFKPGDYISCSKKIEKVLSNTKAYKQESLKTAKNFSADKITDEILNTYNSILSKN
jgi:1,2-diacylglycerol 3-alpha-glucosyltransferase